MTKEEAYDDEIYPLMDKIIEICKRERIAFLADFELDYLEDDPDNKLLCTTALLTDEYEPREAMLQALLLLKPPPAAFAAFTITTARADRGSDSSDSGAATTSPEGE